MLARKSLTAEAVSLLPCPLPCLLLCPLLCPLRCLLSCLQLCLPPCLLPCPRSIPREPYAGQGASCEAHGLWARHGRQDACSVLSTTTGLGSGHVITGCKVPGGFAPGSGLSQVARTHSLFIQLREPPGRG